MTLGEKLLKARLEAGLSQRQLCGEALTRNMLSQIEHGTARPSMTTLQYLAGRLGKSVSYFLEDAPEPSPNQALIAQARRAWAAGDAAQTRAVLAGFRGPDAEYQWEFQALSALAALAAAEAAISRGKDIYARELLREAEESVQVLPGLERQRLLLLGRVPGENPSAICASLPSLDEELQLRARGALEADPKRALALLEAMEAPTPQSLLLKGRALLARKEYAAAAQTLSPLEEVLPLAVYPLLEQCYRELGDYRQAYRCAAAQLKR